MLFTKQNPKQTHLYILQTFSVFVVPPDQPPLLPLPQSLPFPAQAPRAPTAHTFKGYVFSLIAQSQTEFSKEISSK